MVQGDKVAARHGQKGTIGMIYSAADLPFTAESGISPDLILNTHALPSRMTIGMLCEMLDSKVGAISGTFRDGTAFNEKPVEDIATALEDLGFSRYGNEKMRNGYTGELMKMDWFIAPCYYMRLKHQVCEKIHSRNRGIKTLLCRQPMEGRSKGGGLRYKFFCDSIILY